MPIQSIDPATGVLLRSFTPLTDQALLEKIALAETAFSRAAELPLAHRALCMNKLARLLESETADLAALITSEMGKPIARPAPRSPSAPPPAATTPKTPPASSRREPIDAARRAALRWEPSASCSPSCPGTSPSGRSSAFSRPL